MYLKEGKRIEKRGKFKKRLNDIRMYLKEDIWVGRYNLTRLLRSNKWINKLPISLLVSAKAHLGFGTRVITLPELCTTSRSLRKTTLKLLSFPLTVYEEQSPLWVFLVLLFASLLGSSGAAWCKNKATHMFFLVLCVHINSWQIT